MQVIKLQMKSVEENESCQGANIKSEDGLLRVHRLVDFIGGHRSLTLQLYHALRLISVFRELVVWRAQEAALMGDVVAATLVQSPDGGFALISIENPKRRNPKRSYESNGRAYGMIIILQMVGNNTFLSVIHSV